ncbi:MAG: hypothetical protein ABL925_07660 [Methylococcales bacterium]
MIFAAIGLAIVLVAVVVIKYKKNALVETVLNALKAEINGELTKGSLLQDPTLQVYLHGISIMVSAMVAGGRAGGSAGRQPIWYAMANIASETPGNFQILMKAPQVIDSTLKTVFMTGDDGFDSMSTVYIGNQSDKPVVQHILDSAMRYRLRQLIETCPNLRINLLKTKLSVSVPFATIKNGRELNALILLLMDILEKMRRYDAIKQAVISG